jgi:anti-sigma regulatory factor (Ser/Thr protein kinase)
VSLRELGACAGFDEDRIFDISVAASEAAANAIEHAGALGPVTVAWSLQPHALSVRVAGPGAFGLPPHGDQRVHRGLGLPLMARLSDRMVLQATPEGRPGTEVILTFYRGAGAVESPGGEVEEALLRNRRLVREAQKKLEDLEDLRRHSPRKGPAGR